MAELPRKVQKLRSLIPGAAAPTLLEGQLAFNIPDREMFIGPEGGGPGILLLHKTPVFDVRYYGAKGDGATDDTGAFNLAIAKLEAAGGGCLHVPSGIYRLLDALTVSAVPILFSGCGAASTIIWDASHDGPGLYFAACPYVWGEKLVLVSENTGYSASYLDERPAISVDGYTVDAGDPSISGRFRYFFSQLEIRGADDWVGGWNNGIRLYNADNARVDRCRIQGWSNGTVDAEDVTVSRTTSGVAIGGDTQVFRPVVTNCHISDVQRGIYLRDRIGVVSIQNNLIQQTLNAIRCDEDFSIPEADSAFTIKGNTLQSAYQTIYAEQINNVLIEGNQIYRSADCAHDVYRAVVLLNDCNGGVISDNWIENLRPAFTFGDDVERGGGIVLVSSCLNFTVVNNRSRNLYAGVHLDEGTSGCLAVNNLGTSVTLPFVDESTSNIKADGQQCRLYIKDALKVSNGDVNKILVWTGFLENRNKFALGDAGGTSVVGASLVIPAGVSKVDVKFHGITDNATDPQDLFQPYVDLYLGGNPNTVLRLGSANAQKYGRKVGDNSFIYSAIADIDVPGVDVSEGDEIVVRYSAFAKTYFYLLETQGGISSVAGYRTYLSVTTVRDS